MTVQRYDITTTFVSTNDPDGPWVLYADHVAALAEAEQRLEDEWLGRYNAAEQRGYDAGHRNGLAVALRIDTVEYGRNRFKDGRAEALREARAAVAAAIIKRGGYHSADEFAALAQTTIDALTERGGES